MVEVEEGVASKVAYFGDQGVCGPPLEVWVHGAGTAGFVRIEVEVEDFEEYGLEEEEAKAFASSLQESSKPLEVARE